MSELQEVHIQKEGTFFNNRDNEIVDLSMLVPKNLEVTFEFNTGTHKNRDFVKHKGRMFWEGTDFCMHIDLFLADFGDGDLQMDIYTVGDNRIVQTLEHCHDGAVTTKILYESGPDALDSIHTIFDRNIGTSGPFGETFYAGTYVYERVLTECMETVNAYINGNKEQIKI